jgi:hypothetical protein
MVLEVSEKFRKSFETAFRQIVGDYKYRSLVESFIHAYENRDESCGADELSDAIMHSLWLFRTRLKPSLSEGRVLLTSRLERDFYGVISRVAGDEDPLVLGQFIYLLACDAEVAMTDTGYKKVPVGERLSELETQVQEYGPGELIEPIGACLAAYGNYARRKRGRKRAISTPDASEHDC